MHLRTQSSAGMLTWQYGYKCNLSGQAASATFLLSAAWAIWKSYFEPLYRNTHTTQPLTMMLLLVTGNSLVYIRFLTCEAHIYYFLMDIAG